MGDGIAFLLVCVVVVVLANGLLVAAVSILRAGRFGKGHVVGATHRDMYTYRQGLAARAFVPDQNWCKAGDLRRAFLRRWFLFFPQTVFRRMMSVRFWGWCALQGILVYVVWLNWEF